jgi:glycosyltransferase involved in cell wall biosynthesis
MKKAKYCPETCIIFVTYNRKEIAQRSFKSLLKSVGKYRDKIKIIISDASNDVDKMLWADNSSADDVILTPRGVSAATSRNLATSLMLDKYSPKYLCMVEDDFEYSNEWYEELVEQTEKLYGVISPYGLAYGIFSTSSYDIPKERCLFDKSNNVTAYFFGAVANQRFVTTSHYLHVMKGWDSDVLGISYAQTGGQTFRNTMRGYCGAILPDKLSWPIDTGRDMSTWQKGKRDPGPPAHSFNIEEYKSILEQVKIAGFYDDER